MASGTWGGNTDVHPAMVRISFTMEGQQCQTGFKLRDQSLTPLNVQDCAEDVAEWIEGSFKSLFALADRFMGVDVVDMTTGEGGAVSFGNVLGTANVATNATPSTYVQVPVSFKGSLRRRYGQGRGLWPVRSENYVDGNTLNAAGVAAYQGVIDALSTRYLSASPTNTYRMINAHGLIPLKAATPTTPARPAVEPSWYDVTTIRLSTRMSFIRSRQAGRGN